MNQTYIAGAEYTSEAIKVAALTHSSLLDQKVFDVIAQVQKGIKLILKELLMVIRISIILSTTLDSKNTMSLDCSIAIDDILSGFVDIYELVSIYHSIIIIINLNQ